MHEETRIMEEMDSEALHLAKVEETEEDEIPGMEFPAGFLMSD